MPSQISARTLAMMPVNSNRKAMRLIHTGNHRLRNKLLTCQAPKKLRNAEIFGRLHRNIGHDAGMNSWASSITST